LWYAYFIAEHFGRPDEMKHLADKLLAIDPISAISQGLIAAYYWYRGEFNLALECYRKWCRMNPDNLMGGYYLVRSLAMNNKMDECFALVDSFEKKDPVHVFTKFCQFFKYAIQGNKSKAEEILPLEIRNQWFEDFHITSFFMDCYSLLNEKEIAIDWLEHSVKKGWINYPYFSKIDPFLDNIRGEERFKKIMRKVKYEWENFEL
jgi:tetratricopeptide (TPR) repeat protein